MCGIVGFLDKLKNDHTPVGQVILKMLTALGCRGPDSAGVALYSSPTATTDSGLVVRVKLGENGVFEDKSRRILEQVQRQFGLLRQTATTAHYLRFVIDRPNAPNQLLPLMQLIESAADGVEVVSMGRNLEVVKQVGSPQNLDVTYGVSKFIGRHGIGHTRLSTESRVDLSHSQPFWAHGYPDLAIVHNGHITNYHKLRRQYEQHGVKFYTDNDSEIIAIYLAERLAEGMTLEEALKASLIDLDGSFSYLAATAEALGFCKDPFAFKPLLFTETETFVAIATEEIAIRSAFEGKGEYQVREAQAKEVRVWRR
jgi:glutamate synthase domain-containing protein 1